MRNQTIIVSADPRGKHKEGKVVGALLPGTICEIDASQAMDDNGRFAYKPATPGADGAKTQLCILLDDPLQGRTVGQAYVTGDHGFFYVPAEGEQLNVLTDGPVTFADYLIVVNGTGKVKTTTGTPAAQPLRALETLTAVANSLVFCEVTGY